MIQVSFPSGTPRTSLRRAFRAALALGFLVAGAAGAVGACSDGEKCVGGVEINGVCEGKCKPELCLEGNTCVGNRCVLTCDSHLDCFQGSQACAEGTEDDSGAAIMICTPQVGPQEGLGTPCPFGPECGGFALCPDGSACSLTQCGAMPATCSRNAEACGEDETCTVGQCPDGAGCIAATCDATQCTPRLACLSKGEGDAEAYCTQHDCQTDADCPGGFQCGITRDPREICGSDPPKGNSNFCGETSDPCVEPSTFGQGNTFVEGSLCLLRSSCIKRTQCSPCATDLDCSRVEGQRCVQLAGEGRCQRTCATDADCDPDYACDVGAGACTPRFGACKGTGNFCEPCQNDTDCGGPETSKGCAELSGGQRACFDFAFPDTCVTDTDCPASPSGRSGECLDEGEGLAPGDQLYQRCYFPYTPTDNKFGCW